MMRWRGGASILAAALRRSRPDVFSYEQEIELVWKSGPVSTLLSGLFSQLGIRHTTL
jgi:hypothetical protein